MNASANVPRTTVATLRAVKRSLSCECGFSVAASDLNDLIEAAKHHARQAHHMTLAAEQLAALAEELEDATGNAGSSVTGEI